MYILNKPIEEFEDDLIKFILNLFIQSPGQDIIKYKLKKFLDEHISDSDTP